MTENRERKPILPLILFWVFCALSSGVVALGMFVMRLPEVLCWIMPTLIIAMCIIRCIVRKDRLIRTILVCLATLLFALIGLVGMRYNPFWNSSTMRSVEWTRMYNTQLTPAQATADLDQLLGDMKRVHFTSLGTENGLVEAANVRYQEVSAKISSAESVSVNELLQMTTYIMAAFGEAHTEAYANYANEHYRYDYAEMKLNGYEIIAIDGVLLDDYFEAHKEYFSFELKSWGREQLLKRLMSLETMAFLGIENGKVTITYNNGEEEITRDYSEDNYLLYDDYMALNKQYYENRDLEEDFYYGIDEDNSLCILTVDACRYNDDYCVMLEEMFKNIKTKGLQNLAIDLRGNGGGNSRVANELFRYLDIDRFYEGGYKIRIGGQVLDFGNLLTINNRNEDLLFTGNVYALTSANTFSSAMLFAEFITDNGLGELIGEVPGNAPESIGEVVTFQMPNSGIIYQCGMVSFGRADEDKPGDAITPEYECSSEQALDELYRIIKA